MRWWCRLIGSWVLASLLGLSVAAPGEAWAQTGEDQETAEAASRETGDEQSEAGEEGRVGIGVDVGLTSSPISLGLGGLGGLETSTVQTGIRIPLELSARWTLEPRLGFSIFRSVRSGGASNGGQGIASADFTSWRVGGGLQLRRTWSLSDSTRAYFGLALRADYSELNDAASMNQDSRVNRTTTLGAGPVLGGEYFLSEAFSLGLEARIEGSYARHKSPQLDSSSRTEKFGLSHYGGMVVRLYL